MNFNKAFVLGNVTRDPEVRALPSGQQVTNFGIATNRYYTSQAGEKKEEAEFHNIVCFGKLADITARYLKKGSLVLIEGRIKTRNWVDKQGVKQYKTEIIAESMQLGPRSAGGTGNAGGGLGQQPTGYGRPAFGQSQETPKMEDIPVIEENYPAPSEVSLDNNSGEIDVKDIPF
jgi:single-strand DNA-binding protein